MPKYIDFDALGVGLRNPDVFENKGYAYGWNTLIKILLDAPAADPVRHGRWLKGGYVCGETEWICSVCGKTEWRTNCNRMKYCMFCGAKMDEGEDDAEKDM